MAYSLIRLPQDKFLALLTKGAKAYAAMSDNMHVWAVSALNHAAEHGDTRPLNSFYDFMRVSDQTAFKLFVRRVFQDFPEAKFLDFKKIDDVPQFVATEVEARAPFLALVDNLINPDGEKFYKWFDRNPLQQAIILNDAGFLSQLTSLLNKAEGKSKKVEARVSPELIAPLRNLVTMAKAKVEQMAA